MRKILQCPRDVEVGDYSAIFRRTGVRVTTAQLKQLRERAGAAATAQPIIESAGAVALQSKLRVTDGGHAAAPAHRQRPTPAANMHARFGVLPVAQREVCDCVMLLYFQMYCAGGGCTDCRRYSGCGSHCTGILHVCTILHLCCIELTLSCEFVIGHRAQC